MNSTNNLISSDRVIFHQILSLILLTIIIMVTVFGNILVITAILKTPKLRIRSNYLILSLSVTDLTVGVVVMPVFALIDIIYFSDWTFGAVFCDIHVIFFTMLSSTSAFHLVFIA